MCKAVTFLGVLVTSTVEDRENKQPNGQSMAGSTTKTEISHELRRLLVQAHIEQLILGDPIQYTDRYPRGRQRCLEAFPKA